MAFDPFSQVNTKTEPEVIEKIIEKTVYVPQKPNVLFGVIEDKIFIGILTGIILAEIFFRRS